MRAGEVALILVLIFAALVLFLLEILTPSFGLLGAMGTIALVVAAWKGFALSTAVGWIMVIAMVCLVPAYLVLLVKWLPATPLGKRVFLRKARRGEGDGTPQAEKYQSLVGRTGVAETQLRPSGAVRIDHDRVIAVAESGLIEKGCSVTVIKSTGTNVVVRESTQMDN